MRKNQVLFSVVAFGLLVLSVAFLSNPNLIWAKDAKPVPMELDGTEWEVEMVYMTKKGKKSTSGDTLIFSDKKFISKDFKDKGYLPTNYSLTLEEDGATRFGTMQIKDKETSFWKGKVKGNVIDGSVHKQFLNDSTSTTYFTGALVSGDLKPRVKTKPKFPKPTPPLVVKPVPPTQPIVEKANETAVETVGKADQSATESPSE